MEDESAVWQKKPDAPITQISKARHKKAGAGSQLDALKKCASLAADEIIDMLSDKKQFCRHVYQEKSSGSVSEIMLETRNIRHLRDAIAAIRELADIIRGLNGLLPPEAENEIAIQLKKLQLEEKKLTRPEAQDTETGVVLLPAPEDGHA